MKLDHVLTNRARIAITLIAWASLLTTVFAWLYGASTFEPPSRDVDSYGDGPLGHHGWVETLGQLGVHVSRNRSAHREAIPAPVIFLEPTRSRVALAGWSDTFENVIQERQIQGFTSLVVLPKWRLLHGQAVLVPEDEVATLLQSITRTSAAGIRRHPDGADAVGHLVHGEMGTQTVHVPLLQVLTSTDCPDVLAYTDHGPIAVQCGATIVLSEPDLVHNFNFHRDDNAEFTALTVSQNLGSEVVVDEVFHGHGSEAGLGSALGRFPAVLVPVHMLLLGTLVMLAGMRRFGPVRGMTAAFERGPRRIIEVASTVLASGADPSYVVAGYIRHVIRDTIVMIGSEPDDDPYRAAARVDEVAARFGVAPTAQEALSLAEAMTGQSHRKALGPSLDAARRVWRLRSQLRSALTGVR